MAAITPRVSRKYETVGGGQVLCVCVLDAFEYCVVDVRTSEVGKEKEDGQRPTSPNGAKSWSGSRDSCAQLHSFGFISSLD